MRHVARCAREHARYAESRAARQRVQYRRRRASSASREEAYLHGDSALVGAVTLSRGAAIAGPPPARGAAVRARPIGG